MPPKRPLRPVSWLMPACLLLFLGTVLTAFRPDAPPAPPVAAQVRQQFLLDLASAQRQAAQLAATIQLAGRHKAPIHQARQQFIDVKKAYKQSEYLIEYLDPDIARKLNGAPFAKVTVADADYLALGHQPPQFTTVPPEGLQVLEELLFADESVPLAAAEAYAQARRLEEGLTQLLARLQRQPLTDRQIVESLPEQVLRGLTMGITGFDAPGAGAEMALAAAALQPVADIARRYAAAHTGPAQAGCQQAAERVQRAVDYLRQHPDFEAFDRVEFLRELGDPAYAAVAALPARLLPPAAAGAVLTHPVNPAARSLFDREFLRSAYYAKQDRRAPLPAQVALGRTLFFDPALSANNQRACASCHRPAQAFTDGRAKSLAFEAGHTLGRNSPTLLNAIFSNAYFWDGRAGFLEDQIPEVVRRPEELHTSYDELVPKLRQSPAYQKLFRQAFSEQGRDALNATTLNRALAAYLRSLVALDSPFDQYMRRETDVLGAAARRGANLFMGKAACATCHFAPLFNGTVPPRFLESETEVIGVPATADLDHPQPDADLGRGHIIGAEVLRGAFKTPTVRNAALTAPYMHNGALGTLAEVVEFYNRGGGRGLGLPVPNQTLPFDHLRLSAQEKQDLVAFLESLTDNSPPAAPPKHLPAFPASAGLTGRVVGGKY